MNKFYSVTFSQSWNSSCPGTGVTHSTLAASEPTTALDACAPAPGACISGTAGSDIWYFFYAGATYLSIVVNPSFDAAIQAFSSNACPGLAEIGCVDLGGNTATETLKLTGLTLAGRYYIRVFGATASAPNRTGTFTFCGTSATLPATVQVKINYVRDLAILQNPVKGMLVTQARNKMPAYIYNTSGQQLMSLTLQPGRNEIAWPGLTNGIYYLKKDLQILIQRSLLSVINTIDNS